ncbi:alanine racemase [Endozoicomonas lisbonensis]|uniref:D-serine deaminase-like pyridoxal phosphate-dependent protein n=1 Tax=Endozoicomonas lisbonensis TaxID=3120522 RepID=A0ABV2SFX9_9GAMM
MFWAVVFFLLIVSLLLLFRPEDKGQPHDEYFSTLSSKLPASVSGLPHIMVDLERVNHNLLQVREHLGDTTNIRVVAKSLPCPQLLRYILEQLGSNRLMVFHQPFLNQMLKQFPGCDFLLGKPFPIHLLESFYDQLDPAHRERIGQIQWLIDKQSRLEQYLLFARQNRLQLRVSIELNIGLHRGGVASPEQLAAMLTLIRANRDFLKLSGFMGYESHIAKAPFASMRINARIRAQETYDDYVTILRTDYPDLFRPDLCFNCAGSKTYQLYPLESRGAINDISIGSAFVQPMSFDLPTLQHHQPALFISTPVLKKQEGLTIPYLERLTHLLSWFNDNFRQTFFINGGWWKASPSPPGD